MFSYLIPILVMAVIGTIAGIILTIAHKAMAVEINPLTEDLLAALPGVNCGACGFAGCYEYAVALTDDHDINTNLCPPGGDQTAKALAEILGVDFQASSKNFAIVRCGGSLFESSLKMDYRGIPTCKANKRFYRGRFICPQSCLGYGDCQRTCPYNAIHVENGLAKIDRDLCIGCGLCQNACPNNLIDIIPGNARTYVACMTELSDAKTKRACKVGCISCNLCIKACKFDAISINNWTHAVIDYDKCVNCGLCAKVCPRNCIITLPKRPTAKQKTSKKN
ncbi:MAG: RnfABCDGE type electron transport complex subunit B [Bacillota bacterium]|jgi:electron transport complex protein RnfB